MHPFSRSLAALLLGLVSTGCVAASALLYKTTGDPKIPAEYKLKKVPTLVLMENFENPDLFEVQSERVSRDVVYQLTDQKVCPVVPLSKLADLRAKEGNAFRQMNIPAIGRAVGAKQVVYINLTEFSADPALGSEIMRGKVAALVKVVDADTGQTAWPQDTSAGRQIRFETPDVHDSNGNIDVQEKLYQTLADKIARLFYDASTDQVDGSEPKL